MSKVGQIMPKCACSHDEKLDKVDESILLTPTSIYLCVDIYMAYTRYPLHMFFIRIYAYVNTHMHTYVHIYMYTQYIHK